MGGVEERVDDFRKEVWDDDDDGGREEFADEVVVLIVCEESRE